MTEYRAWKAVRTLLLGGVLMMPGGASALAHGYSAQESAGDATGSPQTVLTEMMVEATRGMTAEGSQSGSGAASSSSPGTSWTVWALLAVSLALGGVLIRLMRPSGEEALRPAAESSDPEVEGTSRITHRRKSLAELIAERSVGHRPAPDEPLDERTPKEKTTEEEQAEDRTTQPVTDPSSNPYALPEASPAPVEHWIPRYGPTTPD